MAGGALRAISEDPLVAAERQLEESAPGFLERVRIEAARLGLHASGDGSVRSALSELQEVARVDADVPTQSTSRPAVLAKQGVKSLVGWYMRYLGSQVTALGQATVRLGAALAERSEDLERRVSELERRLTAGAGGAGSPGSAGRDDEPPVPSGPARSTPE